MRTLPLGPRLENRSTYARMLFRPTAPALKDARYEGRSIPEHILSVAPKAKVFEAPGGHVLFEPDKKKRLEHAVKLLENGEEQPRTLDVDRMYSPYPHAWSASGNTLFGASKRKLWRCVRSSLETEVLDVSGYTIGHIAVAGGLLAYETSDHLILRRVEDGAEVHRERGGSGFVAAVGDGRFILQGSLGVGRLFAVRDDEFELVAAYSRRVLGGWDEGGKTFVHVSIDDGSRAGRDDPVATHALLELDDRYPEKWR